MLAEPANILGLGGRQTPKATFSPGWNPAKFLSAGRGTGHPSRRPESRLPLRFADRPIVEAVFQFPERRVSDEPGPARWKSDRRGPRPRLTACRFLGPIPTMRRRCRCVGSQEAGMSEALRSQVSSQILLTEHIGHAMIASLRNRFRDFKQRSGGNARAGQSRCGSLCASSLNAWVGLLPGVAGGDRPNHGVFTNDRRATGGGGSENDDTAHRGVARAGNRHVYRV